MVSGSPLTCFDAKHYGKVYFICIHLDLINFYEHRKVISVSLSAIKKGKFLYSAVSSPDDCSKRFYNFHPQQTCSIKYHLNFSGKT